MFEQCLTVLFYVYQGVRKIEPSATSVLPFRSFQFVLNVVRITINVCYFMFMTRHFKRHHFNLFDSA